MSRRVFALLAAVLPVVAGCMHIYHKPCDDLPWRPADTVPDENKACVYVFLFDDYNPFAAGHLADVRDYLQGLGFGKTYYGWSHHVNDFEVELGTVGAERPNARFAIIGYGHGAKAAHQLAAFANTVGIPIDVMIYLEPTGLDVTEGEPVLNTVVLRGADLEPGEAGTFVGRYLHAGDVPMHPETLKIIEREVTLLGLSLPPPVCPPAPPVFLVPPMPAPRNVLPDLKELPPEWRFLEMRAPWLPPAPPPPPGVETLPYPRLLPELPPPEPKGESGFRGGFGQ
jgi:hypothetical protein